MKRELTEIEIVAIGDELLSGATIDLNAAVIARTPRFSADEALMVRFNC